MTDEFYRFAGVFVCGMGIGWTLCAAVRQKWLNECYAIMARQQAIIQRRKSES